jgi:hypothetical protein
MAHEVFISYSAKDKIAGDTTCHVLEENGLRCWMAPRDILAGASWAASINQGIKDSRVMVLVFSGNANKSKHVYREVELAVDRGIMLVPLRIEDVVPTESMEYFLHSTHWMDAFTPPLEAHLKTLAARLRGILGMPNIAAPVKPPAPTATPLHKAEENPTQSDPANAKRQRDLSVSHDGNRTTSGDVRSRQRRAATRSVGEPQQGRQRSQGAGRSARGASRLPGDTDDSPASCFVRPRQRRLAT